VTNSKTEDIKDAIMRFLDGSSRRLDEIIREMWWVDDRRWVGVAIDLHLVRDGRARYASCDVSHGHNGDCRLEAVAS
jgi:hypothetical protein